jgi:hypothetical protein
MSILAKVISQIKAPFLSILGHVQIAKSHPQGGSLQAIENEARSARELLDRLAQFSGLSQTPSITVPLFDLIDSALRSLEGPLLRGGIKITKGVSEDLSIKCDPDDFKLALTAVFRNSIESMERVLKKDLIIEAVRKNSTFIELSIEDSGEGILPRNLPFLFEPFYSTKSPLDHKGLGLASAQGIFRTHLGEISISSNPDHGTLVKISVPLSIEAPKRLADIQMMGRPAWMEFLKTPTHQELTESESLLEPIEIQKTQAFNTSSVPIIIEPDSTNSNLYTINESDVDFELQSFNFSEGEVTSKSESESKDELTLNNLSEVDIDKLAGLKSRDDSFSTSPFPAGASASDEFTQSSSNSSKQVVEKSLLFSSPVKRLKKKSEPLDKIKVQIPRPEEKL